MLLPEETFSPKPFEGQARNISASGILVEIENISKERFGVLIRSQRRASVAMRAPEIGREIALLGKTVWYDFRRKGRGASCLVGIVFVPLPEAGREALAKLLQGLESEAKTANLRQNQ